MATLLPLCAPLRRGAGELAGGPLLALLRRGASRASAHPRGALAPARTVKTRLAPLPETLCDPPSPEAARAIVAAREAVLGIVEGNNKRSGRKVLRSHLRGPSVKEWYPYTVDELKLDQIGFDPAEREHVYRVEQDLNRLGKSRMKPKMKPPTTRFVGEMLLADNADEILDQVVEVDTASQMPMALEPWFAEAVADGLDERDPDVEPPPEEALNEEERAMLKLLLRDQLATDAAAPAMPRAVANADAGDVAPEQKRRRPFAARQGLSDKRSKSELLQSSGSAAMLMQGIEHPVGSDTEDEMAVGAIPDELTRP